jgi:hypothetical protein
MGVDANRIKLQLYTESRSRGDGDLRAEIKGSTIGSAGRYLAGEKETIAIETSNLSDPMSVAATLSHELAHVRLLGEKRLTGDEDDHELLTDLATVFFGMGIFTANSTFRYSQWSRDGWQGWKASKQGYLDERTLAYALGLWAHLRGEVNPKWMRHLNVNPRAYMNQTLRFLKAQPPSALPGR